MYVCNVCISRMYVCVCVVCMYVCMYIMYFMYVCAYVHTRTYVGISMFEYKILCSTSFKRVFRPYQGGWSVKLTKYLDLMPMLLIQFRCRLSRSHIRHCSSGELLEEVVNPAQVDAFRLEEMYSLGVEASLQQCHVLC